jgi:hypothetical protein
VAYFIHEEKKSPISPCSVPPCSLIFLSIAALPNLLIVIFAVLLWLQKPNRFSSGFPESIIAILTHTIFYTHRRPGLKIFLKNIPSHHTLRITISLFS